MGFEMFFYGFYKLSARGVYFVKYGIHSFSTVLFD